MGFLEKLLGDPNKKEVKKIEKIVDGIEALDESMQALSDEALKAKTEEFKKRLEDGETVDDIMAEAFAVAREAGVRTLGLKAYRVQLRSEERLVGKECATMCRHRWSRKP